MTSIIKERELLAVLDALKLVRKYIERLEDNDDSELKASQVISMEINSRLDELRAIQTGDRTRD